MSSLSSHRRVAAVLLGTGAVVTLAAWVHSLGGEAPASDEPGRTSLLDATRTGRAAKAPIQAAAAVEEAGDAALAYVPGELIVQLHDVEDAEAVALAVQGEVMSRSEAGRFARIQLADAVSISDAREQLRQDPRVRDASPNGRIFGAGRGGKTATTTTTTDSTTTTTTTDSATTTESTSTSTVQSICDMKVGRSKITRADSRQWHLAEAKAPQAGQVDLSGYVVAVLDTGVAYEDYSDAHGSYVRAPSLSSVRFVAPLDLVNGDLHPNDDHQHGTHIASTIASWGSVEGVAPGASIMPIKVLDNHNSGMESNLIAAIWHAIDNGAHVINMSLSFVEGYHPSPALEEALQAADDAGILLVAAAGNDGANYVTWPAAHRAVIAAGGTRPGATRDAPLAAYYSNRSTRVDIVSPGGVVGNGGLDGIIAETIDPADPTAIGLWQIAGTSQAAAITSGAVLYVLKTGIPVDQVRGALQAGAYGLQNEIDFYSEGLGAGWLRIDKAVEKACNGASGALVSGRFDASMMLWMTQEPDGSVVPRARVTVVDPLGQPVGGVKPQVSIWGSTGGSGGCVTDAAGTCDLAGPAAIPEDPAAPGLAWGFSLDAVVDRGVGVRPGNVLFGSDALEILLQALADERVAYDALAVHWQAGPDAELGQLMDAYMVMNAGTGLATSPMGLVFTPDATKSPFTTERAQLNLDGTGLATSPMGFFSVRLVSFDGSGLATSPMGFRSLRLVAFDGSGLATSPMGLRADTVWGGAGGAYDSGLLSLEGSMVNLSDGAISVNATGTLLDGIVGSGGFRTVDGYPAAAQLAGSGAVDSRAIAVSLVPSGHGSEPL